MQSGLTIRPSVPLTFVELTIRIVIRVMGFWLVTARLMLTIIRSKSFKDSINRGGPGLGDFYFYNTRANKRHSNNFPSIPFSYQSLFLVVAYSCFFMYLLFFFASSLLSCLFLLGEPFKMGDSRELVDTWLTFLPNRRSYFLKE